MTTPKTTKELEGKINNFIGWNSKFGLHISDGVDSCSGNDHEEEEKAKKYLLKLFKSHIRELLPEKKNKDTTDTQTWHEIAPGWNACIEEIEKRLG